MHLYWESYCSGPESNQAGHGYPGKQTAFLGLFSVLGVILVAGNLNDEKAKAFADDTRLSCLLMPHDAKGTAQ